MRQSFINVKITIIEKQNYLANRLLPSTVRMSRRFSINDIELPPDLMKGLSMEVLKELNKQDDATFFQFFEGLKLDDVKKVRDKSQQLRDSNKEFAVNNIELEPKFTEMKSALLEKATQLSQIKEEYDKKLLELKAIQNKTNHPAMEKELAQATKAIERESDGLAAEFVSGKSSLSLEEFQEKFIEQRTLFWLRRVKSEKMKELLMNYRPVPTPRTAHSIPSTGPANSNTASPPYPTPLQSLPAQHMPQSSPGYPTQPSTSLPPYPPNNTAMPAPSRPFPPAAYAASGRPPYSGLNQHRY